VKTVLFLLVLGGFAEPWAHGISESDHHAMLEGG
jgi:hypothetical protein